MTAGELEIIISADVNSAIASFNKLGYTITKTEQKATKFTKKSGTDFTGLSRVLQDLPFGFTAISNNLTQLLPAAGSLGLAFSALVSTLTFMQVGFGAWTRGMGGAKDAAESLAKTTDILSKSLESSEYKQAITNVTELATNIKLAKDGFLNKDQVVKQYNDTIGKTTGLVKTLDEAENELAKNADAYIQFTLKKAAANIALGNAAQKSFESEQKRLESLKDFKSAGDVLSVRVDVAAVTKGAKTAQEARLRVNEAYEKKINELREKGREDQAMQAELAADEQISIAQKFQKEAAEIAKQFKFNFFGDNDPGKELKEVIEKGPKANAANLSWQIVDIDGTAAHFATDINRAIDKSAENIKPGVALEQSFDLVTTQAGNIAQILSQTLTPAVNSVFNAMASGQSVFESLGNAIKGIIVKLATAVIEAALFAIIINTITGGVASFAGFGKIFSTLSGLPKFATGGVVTKPTLALVGEQGPERITPLGYENSAQQNWGGEVVFQISGQNLRGILRRADNSAFNTF